MSVPPEETEHVSWLWFHCLSCLCSSACGFFHFQSASFRLFTYFCHCLMPSSDFSLRTVLYRAHSDGPGQSPHLQALLHVCTVPFVTVGHSPTFQALEGG